MVVINDVVSIGAEDQLAQRLVHGEECRKLIQQSEEEEETKFFGCPAIWDAVMCWPDTPAGVTAEAKCPDYIDGFTITGRASRNCTAGGTWFMKPGTNTSYTDFLGCVAPSETKEYYDMYKVHLEHIRIIYNLGYGLSLISLIVAVLIMAIFRKLHCPRNTLHINLFISFILRAALSFVRDHMMVSGVGLQSDVTVDANGNVHFNDNAGTHWECKLLMTIFNYVLSANYMWIFAEGLYLHMLIFVSVFSEGSSIRRYIIMGWVLPVSFVIPWVIVRATLEDELCWNTHPTIGYFWIIRGPITFTILVNFVLFANIVRVIFTKLDAPGASASRPFRYRKLAKSTLVLIPLFGMHYVLFLGLPEKSTQIGDIIKLYFEMFFNSIQGFMVALLFCFLNGECQAELKKTWERYNLRNGHLSHKGRSNTNGTWNTMTSYVTRARHSLQSLNSIQNYSDNQTMAISGHLTPSSQGTEDIDVLKTELDAASSEPLNPNPAKNHFSKHESITENNGLTSTCNDNTHGLIINQEESKL